MRHPAQALVIEFYLAIERAEGHGSVNRARAAARAINYSFTNADSTKWLAPFIDAARKRRANGALDGAANEHETARSTDSVVGLTRDKVIPTLPLGPVVESKASTTPQPKRTPAQKRLKLRTQAEETADEALTLLRPLVEPYAERMSWTVWRTRSRSCAVKMAATMTATEIVALFRRWQEGTSRDFGMLAWAAEWSERGEQSPSGGSGLPRGVYAPAGTVPHVCDDGTVIYGNPNDPAPLSEILAG